MQNKFFKTACNASMWQRKAKQRWGGKRGGSRSNPQSWFRPLAARVISSGSPPPPSPPGAKLKLTWAAVQTSRYHFHNFKSILQQPLVRQTLTPCSESLPPYIPFVCQSSHVGRSADLITAAITDLYSTAKSPVICQNGCLTIEQLVRTPPSVLRVLLYQWSCCSVLQRVLLLTSSQSSWCVRLLCIFCFFFHLKESSIFYYLAQHMYFTD